MSPCSNSTTLKHPLFLSHPKEPNYQKIGAYALPCIKDTLKHVRSIGLTFMLMYHQCLVFCNFLLQIVANRLPIKSGESLSATKTIKEGHTNRSPGKGATGVSNIWMNKQARPRHIVDGMVELPFHKSKKRLDTLNSSFMKQTASRRSPNLVGAQITPKMAINTTSNVSKVHSKLLLDVEH